DSLLGHAVGPVQLTADTVHVACARHHERPLRGDNRPHPKDRLLDQRPIAEDLQELLGVELAAERPEPGPAPAGQHDDIEMWDGLCHNPLSMRSCRWIMPRTMESESTTGR